MADNTDEVSLKLDTIDRVHKLFKSWGATDEQAEVAAASQAKRFTWDGVLLRWAATSTSAVDDPAVKAFYADAGFRFLLPPPKAEDNTPVVDANVVRLRRLARIGIYRRDVVMRDDYRTRFHRAPMPVDEAVLSASEPLHYRFG